MSRSYKPGDVVALRYVISGVLGRGGMATVYRARHRNLDREVALKILDPRRELSSGIRFEREARNAARLDHPGIVRVTDYGTAVDGRRFIAMDLLEGPTLGEVIIDRGPFEIGRATWVASELLKALAHAHDCGVLHRDIKPANVMFTERNEIVLIDFGLSHLEDDAPLTALGTCVGSPSYLSPERLLGEDYDERADLYAVGIILYEMLAGRRPYIGADPMDIAARHIQEAPPPLRGFRADVSADLADIVHRAIAKDPEQRFGSAREMLVALELAPRTTSAPIIAPAPTELVEESTLLEFEPPHRRSLWRRTLGWLRYGRWRWREPSDSIGVITADLPTR
jgi:serine/threonine-protein kinase